MSSVLDDVVEELEPAPNIVSVMEGTKPSFLLSIDVGTSGVRAALFDEHGRPTGVQVRNSRDRAPVSDFAELDPDVLVDEVIKTIDELFTYHYHSAGQLELIAISAFWHSLLGIDAEGRPSTQLLTWADTRAAQVANNLRGQFDEQEIHSRTGCRFHPSYWPAKLQWLKSHQSESFSNTRCWLGLAEYLCLRLFGETAISVSMASATGLFNQRSCDWDWDFVDALSVSPDTLPQVKERLDAKLSDVFAFRWPALAEARLVTIVGDGAANNIGAGCSTKDKIALMVGTSGAMRVAFKGEPPSTLAASLWSYRVACDRVVVGGALSDGGGLFQWLTQTLNVNDDPVALQNELAALEPDSHGLTVLPFWSGERSTGWLADASGGIFGLRQQTKSVEIVRAVLESIAYRFALLARDLNSIAPEAAIVASGNALRSSPLWVQILADVLGRPLLFGGAAEASIRGAALLALEAVGKIGTIEEESVLVEQVFEPDLTRHARYQEGLARQQELYERFYSPQKGTKVTNRNR
ncbi:MAG TPA: gluconokinase [Pyrinomonadaceae bacterium]|nr:gluconokinase [Pyrinomonadaceae bacterium]